MKTCTKCGEEKPLTEYYKEKRQSSGLTPQCKVCIKARVNDHRLRNLDAIKLKKKQHYRENRERINKKTMRYYYDNREAVARQKREYSKSRTAEINATSKKYKVAKLQRKASWANEQLIAAYYMEAKRLEELTGIQFHVDHIIPLQGEMVSGLHVETNLQLLPAHENIGKSNRFDPETFVA